MFASFMINAWEAATVVAIVAGVVGFFTVLRGAAFAAHSLPNGAFAGAAGAFLIGANTIVGLGVFSLAGAGMIAGLGRRARSDVATALTIVLMLALGDLFLSRTSEYAPEIFALLFGEVLGVSSSKLGPTVVIAAVCIVAVVALYRPLMLSSVTPDVAAARGINPRLMDLAFLVVVALVTTMAVPVVGSLLIFSLLIGPPAAARSFTNRPPIAIVLSVVFALVTVWVAIAVSYLTNLPIGFFVGATERVRLHRRAGMDRLAADHEGATASRSGRSYVNRREASEARSEFERASGALASEEVVTGEDPRRDEQHVRNLRCRDEPNELLGCRDRAVRSPRKQVDHDRGDRHGDPKGDADRRARGEEQRRRARVRDRTKDAHREDAWRARGVVSICLGREPGRCRPRLQRRADPGRLVTDPDQDPDQQERRVQGPIGLGQGTDREVVLVRPGVDAEHVPRKCDKQEDQPGCDTSQGEPAPAASATWPGVPGAGQAPTEVLAARPSPQCGVHYYDGGQ